MTDTTQTPAKRQAVADRQWIDKDAKVTADETQAIGFRYVLLGEGKDKAERVANGHSFEYLVGDAGKPATMLGIFGGLTKTGNIVNTMVNDKTDPVTDPQIILAGIKDWFAQLDEGKWGEERVGGIARFDREILATALHNVTKRPRDEFVAKLADGAAKVRINAQNKADPEGKREVLYGTYALYNTSVKTEYNKLAGTGEPQLADL